MNKAFVITFLFFFVFANHIAFAQTVSAEPSNLKKSKWTTGNPFKTDVFVENFGQFNNWAKETSAIKYAVNNSDKIFFTQHGLTFRLEKREEMNEEEREEMEREQGEKERRKIETYFVFMNWVGCNPNSNIEASEQTGGYYTFGEKGFEKVKAKGYKKLLYKNLYPQIDVEYIISEKGGIKYQLILHPGADVSVVKMNYSGDVEEIKTDGDGNTIIKTPAGEITDHAPQSFYEGNKKPIPSSFEIKDNTISFQLQTTNNQLQTILIDPWTTTPTSLTANNDAFDVDYDDNGNVYVSGGAYPYKLAKYSSTGSLLWTFTNPANWGLSATYSKFCVIHQTGTIFLGEGAKWNSGGTYPRIMKINSDGTINITSAELPSDDEIWLMFYNRCTGQLVAFGGGILNGDNVKIVDTNLISNTSKNFNGDCNNAGDYNDIACAVMDFNGDFYALVSSYNCPKSNFIEKSLFSNNYDPPLALNINSGYNFSELNHNGIPGLSLKTVRANALALNTQYLYSYDGKTLKAWDKANGNQLGTVLVSAGYADGRDRTHEGIAVDECNNVYVGGTNTVHVYTFDGINFFSETPVTTDISNEVYDVKLDGISGLLYVSGNGFVTVSNVTPCILSSLVMKDSVDCGGYAIVDTVIGGIPPYSYLWSNGDTTNSISVTAFGVYTVTITDNSCIPLQLVDTVVIDTIDFNSDFSTVTQCFTVNFLDESHCTPPVQWLWKFGDGWIDTLQNPIHIYDSIGIYDVTLITIWQGGYTDSVTKSVKVKSPSLDFLNNTVCLGDTTIFTGIATCSPIGWAWDFGDASPLDYNQNSNHIYTTAGNYSVKLIATWFGGYKDSVTKIVTVLNTTGNANFYFQANCGFTVGFFDSSLGNSISWQWDFGDGIGTDFRQNPTYWYSVKDSYLVTLIVDYSSWCSPDTISKWISFQNQSSFNLPDTVCVGTDNLFIINFTGDTASINYYYFDVGDGNWINWDESMGPWNDTLFSLHYTYNSLGTYYTYFEIYYDNWNCWEAFYDTVYVVSAQVQADFGISDDSICIGNTITFSDSSTGTIAFWEWNFDDSSLLDTTQNPQHTYLTTGIFNVQLRVDTSGCANDISKTVVVFPLPNPNTGNDTTICFGDTITLYASGGTSYIWTPNTNLSNNAIFNPFAFPTNNIQYKVLVTDINGCKNTDSVNIFIQPLPAANIFTPDSQLCQGDTISIAATSQNGTVLWTEDGKGNITGQSSNTIVYYSDKTDTGEINFIIQVSSPIAACGIEKDTFILQIKNSPIVSLTISRDTICQNFGEEIHLKAIGASTYEWSSIINIDTTFLASPQDTLTVVPNEPTIYLVKGTDPNNCKNFAQKEITVLSRPIPELTTNSSYDCYPVEVVYQYDLSISIPLDSAIWDLGNGLVIKNQNPVKHLYEESNTQDYPVRYSAIVKLYYQNGCRAEDTVELTICENFYLPNTFTPDGDGKNDFFVIKGVDEMNCDFKVFNRWGEKIYESKNYLNDWDGHDLNGNILNTDTYYYLLGCGEKKWTGWVKIIR